MPRDAQLYLADIIDHCDFLLRWRVGVTISHIDSNWETRLVIERAIQNIGEAVFQLRRSRPDLVERISDSEQIIGIRHILVHAYHLVKARILYEVVNDELERLRQEAATLLAEMNDAADNVEEGDVL